MSLDDLSPSAALPPWEGREYDHEALASTSGRLGWREREVLEVVWAGGNVTVQQVSKRLSIRLAYTTVMTTLDRLFKKGLLRRVKQDRAFLYSPALSPADLESLRARALLERFFTGTASDPEVLLSCLVDVIGKYDDDLLKSLEEKVRDAKLRRDRSPSAG